MTGGVSILMASYNGSAFIDEQLQSITAQLSPQDELIVIDDGSSDRTIDIIVDYVRRFENMRLIENPRNLGVRKTFEALIVESRNEIVFLSDQDDVWIDGRKARMVEALHQNNCVAVLSNAVILTEKGVGRNFFPGDQDPDVGSIARNFIRNNFIGCCMAFRRDVATVALPFPRNISMHDWWIGSCAMALGKVCYLAEPTLLYRRHGGNQSAGTRRPWRVVMRDRRGNLLALVTLLGRLLRLRHATMNARQRS